MKDLCAWRQLFGPELVGESPRFVKALRALQRVAERDSTVVITGETGTGKGLLAQTLHRASNRRGKPFVDINCAALPESLLESELFGHVKGGFTGAINARPGLFVTASGGTLFLDEIGELSLSAQAKLLRVLEAHTITPVGSDLPVAVDVRVVAATHRDLQEMVVAGTFREDLFYRLCVLPIELPPLRERADDLDQIADAIVARLCAGSGAKVRISDEVRELLRAHSWPGNVRELHNCLERALVLAASDELTADDIYLPAPQVGERVRGSTPELPRPLGLLEADLEPERSPDPPGQPMRPSMHLRDALAALERHMIGEALGVANGNRTEAAALLGLNRTTLVEKLRKYGV